jgi:hypothetical protein
VFIEAERRLPEMASSCIISIRLTCDANGRHVRNGSGLARLCPNFRALSRDTGATAETQTTVAIPGSPCKSTRNRLRAR